MYCHFEGNLIYVIEGSEVILYGEKLVIHQLIKLWSDDKFISWMLHVVYISFYQFLIQLRKPLGYHSWTHFPFTFSFYGCVWITSHTLDWTIDLSVSPAMGQSQQVSEFQLYKIFRRQTMGSNFCLFIW